MGRRDFLKSSASGLGGLIYLSSNEKSLFEKERGVEGGEDRLPYSGPDRDQTSGHHHGGHEHQQPLSGYRRLESGNVLSGHGSDVPAGDQ